MRSRVLVDQESGRISFDEGDPDAGYEDKRQRDLDDQHEAERAFFEGKEAGRQEARPGLNPYHPVSDAYNAWERGRSTVEAERLSAELARRARPSCNHCTCGGRGLCRDHA